jgi:hypothetical protein
MSTLLTKLNYITVSLVIITNDTISDSSITIYKYTFFVTNNFNARCIYTMYKILI